MAKPNRANPATDEKPLETAPEPGAPAPAPEPPPEEPKPTEPTKPAWWTAIAGHEAVKDADVKFSEKSLMCYMGIVAGAMQWRYRKAGTVRFAVRTPEAITQTGPTELEYTAMLHGFGQKIGDKAAKKDATEAQKFGLMTGEAARLSAEGATWNSGTRAVTPRVDQFLEDLVLAVSRATMRDVTTGKDVPIGLELARKSVAAKSEPDRQKMARLPRYAELFEAVVAERIKAAGVDPEKEAQAIDDIPE